MDRYVIMVDAGYLLRQGLAIVSDRAGRSRSELDIIDPAGLIALIVQRARSALSLEGKELLRVYWYDGVGAVLTPQQKALIDVDDVQLRAGTINGAGQQKGVDSLIVTDLIELTSHHAVCDAVLVTGDSDLAVGIELAQRRGVRIAVLGIEDVQAGILHNQSFEITSRADRVAYLGRAELSSLLKFVARSAPTSSPQPLPAMEEAKAIEHAVRDFAALQASTLTGAIDSDTGRIDGAIDRALLHHVYQALDCRPLSNTQKVRARELLRQHAETAKALSSEHATG